MTTTEEVIRLTREVADASLNDPVVGSSIVLDIGEMKRLIKLVKAEENEACERVCEALLSEWTGTSDANDDYRYAYRTAIEAIKARRMKL